jgi:hypothetical protein
VSASQCIKCEKIVGGYEKYCEDCIRTYGVMQDRYYWRTRGFNEWQNNKAEFEKDLAAVPANFSPAPKAKPNTPEIKTVYIPASSKPSRQSDPAYRKRFGSRPMRS